MATVYGKIGQKLELILQAVFHKNSTEITKDSSFCEAWDFAGAVVKYSSCSGRTSLILNLKKMEFALTGSRHFRLGVGWESNGEIFIEGLVDTPLLIEITKVVSSTGVEEKNPFSDFQGAINWGGEYSDTEIVEARFDGFRIRTKQKVGQSKKYPLDPWNLWDREEEIYFNVMGKQMTLIEVGNLMVCRPKMKISEVTDVFMTRHGAVPIKDGERQFLESSKCKSYKKGIPLTRQDISYMLEFKKYNLNPVYDENLWEMSKDDEHFVYFHSLLEMGQRAINVIMKYDDYFHCLQGVSLLQLFGVDEGAKRLEESTQSRDYSLLPLNIDKEWKNFVKIHIMNIYELCQVLRCQADLKKHGISPKLGMKKLLEWCSKSHYQNPRDEAFAAEAGVWRVREEPDENGVSYPMLEDLYLKSQEVKPLIDLSIEDGEYKMYSLKRNDCRGMFLGNYSGCCQHPYGQAWRAAIHGQTSEKGGFVIIEKNKTIMACSWIWANGRDFVFDSIEGNIRSNEKAKMLYERFSLELIKIGWRSVKRGTCHSEELDVNPCTPTRQPSGVYNRDASVQYLIAGEA